MYHMNDGYNDFVGFMALFLVASCIDEWRNCALYPGEVNDDYNIGANYYLDNVKSVPASTSHTEFHSPLTYRSELFEQHWDIMTLTPD